MPMRAIGEIDASTRKMPLLESAGVTILPLMAGSSKNTAFASLIKPPDRVNRVAPPRTAPLGLRDPRDEGTKVTGPLFGGLLCLESPNLRPGMVLVFGGSADPAF